jgi:polar amino acid transport system permease protein
LALGLTEIQSTRFVILPQAVRRVMPPLLNDFIALQKDVALVSILGPLEAFRVAQIDASSNFNYTPLLAAAVLYLLVTVPLARIVDRMQARDRLRRSAGAPA